MRNQSTHTNENSRISERTSRRRLSKGLDVSITEEEKHIIKGFVQGYLDANDLKKPKDIFSSLEEIYDEMERIEEVRDIAGHRNRMEQLIRDAIGM